MIYPDNSHRRPRTRLIIAVTAVVCLVVGGVAVFLFTRDSKPESLPTPPPVVTSSVTTTSLPPEPVSSESSLSGEPPAVPAADGCLGGPDPFTAPLNAQKVALLDEAGAASFARAVARWGLTYPLDPSAAEVSAAIAVPDGPAAKSGYQQMNEGAQTLFKEGYTQARVVPGKGEYRIVAAIGPADSLESAILDLIVYRELTKSDGSVEEIKMTSSIHLESADGKWYVFGSSAPPIPPSDTDLIAFIPFAGEC